MHYYKFNVASWAKDTSHLSPMEEGIYLRLINHYYDTEKPIPLKTHLVFRKLRLADQSESAELILDEFFTKTKDGWIHNHCEKLIGEYQKMAERNKKNAKLGGRPKNNDLEKPTGLQDGSEEKPTGIPNQEPITNNQKPETNNDKVDQDTPADSKSERMDYSAIQEIWNRVLTKASPLSVMTDKRKRIARKFFNQFNLDLQKWENYLDYISTSPQCDWMFEARDRGNGQSWQPKGFEYIASENCYLKIKEMYV